MTRVVTQRDLAEAHSYHRRRLLTALVSGSPDPDVESLRPGRVLAGGLALAALLVAGAAVAGVVTDPPHSNDPVPAPPAPLATTYPSR